MGLCSTRYIAGVASMITSADVLDPDAADGDHVAGGPLHERHDDVAVPVCPDLAHQVGDAEPGRGPVAPGPVREHQVRRERHALRALRRRGAVSSRALSARCAAGRTRSGADAGYAARSR
jgi:hypothetical protein